MGPKLRCSPFLRVSSGNLNQPKAPSLFPPFLLLPSPLSASSFHAFSLTYLKTPSSPIPVPFQAEQSTSSSHLGSRTAMNPPPDSFRHPDEGMSMMATPSSSIGTPARKRVSQACKPCGNKKIKCDGALPHCTPCVHRGLDCEYGVSKRRSVSFAPAMLEVSQRVRILSNC